MVISVTGTNVGAWFVRLRLTVWRMGRSRRRRECGSAVEGRAGEAIGQSIYRTEERGGLVYPGVHSEAPGTTRGARHA